tara:strand:+ start:124 stop:315 length:192 start_codon:yes stop_codon:yes gene_type:complete
MNLKTLNLINTFPTLTPMEENRSNLEVSITMMMITGQIAQEKNPELTDALIIAAAALHNAAEA